MLSLHMLDSGQMALVSFAGIASKNPLINGQVVERKADRVIVHTREKIGTDDIQKLARIIKANGEIGPGIASEISLHAQANLECNQFLAGMWQSARDTGPSAQVIRMAEEILASKAG
jgi:hypothetical protein